MLPAELLGAPSLPAVMPNPTVSAPIPQQAGRRWWLGAAGLAAAACLGGLLWLQPWATVVTGVGAEVATPGLVSRVLAVNGRVAGEVSVEVRPLVGGTLLDVRVHEGEFVEVGAVLAVIDPATQAAVVRQALAGLDAALVAQVGAQLALDRTKALGTNAARVVLDSAARSVQSSTQEVARMRALLEQSQIQLAHFTVRAPVTGSVLTLTAQPGQSADPSVALLTLADLGRLMVKTDVDETYATQIRTGQPAALQLAGETEVRLGHVSFVSQRVDAATGGLAVELTPETPLAAPVGLTVTANITVDERAAAITVPRAAIVRDETGSGVFVIRDGIARRQPVAVIEWPAARLIVTKGLAAGDLVISDSAGITVGQAVKVAP